VTVELSEPEKLIFRFQFVEGFEKTLKSNDSFFISSIAVVASQIVL
jgi:hypothetical protein